MCLGADLVVGPICLNTVKNTKVSFSVPMIAWIMKPCVVIVLVILYKHVL